MSNETKPAIEMVNKSELDDANKAFESQRQQIMDAAATNKETYAAELEEVVKFHNDAITKLSSAIKSRGLIALALAVMLAMSITVIIVMVIGNIGGLK